MVPTLMSSRLAKNLNLRVKETDRKITVAAGSAADCNGMVGSVPLTFDDIQIPIYLLVVEGPHFEMIVGSPTLEDLQACIDLGNHTVKIKFEGRIATLSQNYDSGYIKTNQGKTNRDDFTSGFDNNDSSSSEKDYVSLMPFIPMI